MFPRSAARFNRAVTNPFTRVFAWLLPPFAVIVHRGRSSGRLYRTPVMAFSRKPELVVVLSYGESSDWVRNVIKADGGQVRWAGRKYALVSPRIVPVDQAGPLSPFGRFSTRFAEKVIIFERAKLNA